MRESLVGRRRPASADLLRNDKWESARDIDAVRAGHRCACQFANMGVYLRRFRAKLSRPSLGLLSTSKKTGPFMHGTSLDIASEYA